jgi:hypothetical protein
MHWEDLTGNDDRKRAKAYKVVGVPLPAVTPMMETADTPALPRKEEARSCSAKKCKEPSVVSVAGHLMCERHWKMFRSSKPARYWEIRELLGMTDEKGRLKEEEVAIIKSKGRRARKATTEEDPKGQCMPSVEILANAESWKRGARNRVCNVIEDKEEGQDIKETPPEAKETPLDTAVKEDDFLSRLEEEIG